MDPFIGEIRPFPFTFAPVGWLFCDGSLVSISDYQTLYSLLGTTYGGDGVNNFGLPDLRGRVPMGVPSNTSVGTMGGTENATVTGNQLPSHTHPILASTSATAASPAGARPGTPATRLVYGTGANAALAADSVAPSTGGGQSHPNVQPFLTLAYAIATDGIYPTPN